MIRSLIGVFVLSLWGQPSAAQPIEQLVAKAVADGLPAAPLTSKIKEGRAKQVPEARIRIVLIKLVGYMKQARAWLSKRPTKPGEPPRRAGPSSRLLIAAAQARLAGVSESSLKTLLARGQDQGRALRIDAFVDLHLRGYRDPEMLSIVQHATPAEATTLGAKLDALRKGSGLTHAELTDLVLKTIKINKGSIKNALRGTVKSIKIKRIPPGQLKPKAHPSHSKKKKK